MKKVIIALLALSLLFVFAACGTSDEDEEPLYDSTTEADDDNEVEDGVTISFNAYIVSIDENVVTVALYDDVTYDDAVVLDADTLVSFETDSPEDYSLYDILSLAFTSGTEEWTGDSAVTITALFSLVIGTEEVLSAEAE